MRYQHWSSWISKAIGLPIGISRSIISCQLCRMRSQAFQHLTTPRVRDTIQSLHPPIPTRSLARICKKHPRHSTKYAPRTFLSNIPLALNVDSHASPSTPTDHVIAHECSSLLRLSPLLVILLGGLSKPTFRNALSVHALLCDPFLKGTKKDGNERPKLLDVCLLRRHYFVTNLHGGTGDRNDSNRRSLRQTALLLLSVYACVTAVGASERGMQHNSVSSVIDELGCKSQL